MDQEKNAGAKEAEMKKKDWLVMELKNPVEYQGVFITQLDLTGIREMTGRDLNVVYDLYGSMGGGGIVMQESTLLFAQVIASRVCGYPLEALMELKAKDSMTLKNRVYRFFFL